MKSLKDVVKGMNASGGFKATKAPEYTLGSQPVTWRNALSSPIDILEARFYIEEAFSMLRASLNVTGCIDEPSYSTIKEWEEQMMARWSRIAKGKLKGYE